MYILLRIINITSTTLSLLLSLSPYPSFPSILHSAFLLSTPLSPFLREDNIPQLEDISQYKLGCTGWQLWPVIG